MSGFRIFDLRFRILKQVQFCDFASNLRSCLKMIMQIYCKRKFIAVGFSQRNISKEANGFSQKSRRIMLPYYLAKADLSFI